MARINAEDKYADWLLSQWAVWSKMGDTSTGYQITQYLHKSGGSAVFLTDNNLEKIDIIITGLPNDVRRIIKRCYLKNRLVDNIDLKRAFRYFMEKYET